MKKILTASLVAMMAVTAARADIASTGYVDTKATAAQTAAETTAAGALASAKTELEGKITAEETRATGVESGFATRIQALEAATGDGEGSVLADAKAYTDTEVGKVNTALTTEVNRATAEEADIRADFATADAALKSAYEAADQTLDGKITAEAGAREAADTAINNTIGTLPAGKGSVVAYIEEVAANAGTGASGALEQAKTYTDGKVSAEATARDEAIAAASAATKTAYETYADQAETDAIAAAAEAAKIYIDETELNASQTAQDTALKAYADSAAGAVNTALGEYKTEMETTVSGLNTAISNEATARSEADTGLSDRIDVLEAASGAEGTTTKAIEAAQDAADAAQEYAEGVNTALTNYQTTNNQAVAAVKATADAAQVKSEADLAIGTATGGWTTLDALPDYCATGSCALSSVEGAVKWVKIQ